MKHLATVTLVIAAPAVVAGLLVAGLRGAGLGAAIALVVELVAWACSRPILSRVFSATAVDEATAPELVGTVNRLAQQAGIRPPVVAISALPIPNALAAVTPRGGLICVTRGLIEMLSPAELEAVLAHEIAHLTQPYRASATLAAVFAAVPGAIIAASGCDLYFERPYRRSRIRLWGGRRLQVLRDLIALASAPLAAVLVRLSTSPDDELAADLRAARLTGDVASFARALRKLQPLAGRIAWPVNPALAHMLVVHPFGAMRLGQLFDTHPPLTTRLLALAAPTDA